MEPTVLTYLLYVLLSVTLTVWVAQTLARNGRRFLLDNFQGDRELADVVLRAMHFPNLFVLGQLRRRGAARAS